MQTKIFGDKKIIIRKLSQKDLKKVKEFHAYINSLVKEDAQIALNKRMSLKKEKEWLKDELKKVAKHQGVILVAEHEGKIAANTDINLSDVRHNHVGVLGISVGKNYRRIGLGKYLMAEILKLAKKELKPRPKIIRLSVFPDNKPAMKIYKRFGFKQVARIPKQIQYKRKLIDEIVMIKYL